MIRHQAKLDALHPTAGFPLVISFRLLTKFTNQVKHVPILLHAGVESLELGPLAFKGESIQNLFVSILNHYNLKILLLKFIMPSYLAYRLFHRLPVSNALRHLCIEFIVLTSQHLLLSSRALAETLSSTSL